jgi:hypothetical protein
VALIDVAEALNDDRTTVKNQRERLLDGENNTLYIGVENVV